MTTKDIQFLRITHLRGPNIWTYRSVIEAWVNIGELENHPSNTLPGFYERLTQLLPGLVEHRCGVGERGGFLQRLREGTWAAHILEHVAIELQNLAGMQTGFGKARETSVSGIYKIAFRTRQEDVGRAALIAGRDLLLAAIEDRPYDVTGSVLRLRELCDRLSLGPSTAHIVDAAIDRQIPHLRLNEGNLVQFGYGSRQHRIWTAETDQTSAIAESIASDKHLTKSLLACCGVPVPEGHEVENSQGAWATAQEIGMPVVVKPTDANHGRGVFTNLMTQEEVEKAYAAAREEGGGVLVEKFIVGDAHRLLVVGNQVVAATRGKMMTVLGDGVLTIKDLIESQINSDPRCGVEEEFPLEPLYLEQEPIARLELERQGMTGLSIPSAGQSVLLKRNGDLAYDVTDAVHPDVARAAVLAARVVGLDIAGIDLVAQDISQSLESQGGAIIEVNAGPGLLMHLKPAEGQSRPVGKAIVNHLFAQDEDGRIPVIGIAGSKDTTGIARLVAWLLHISGRHVGLTCKDGFFLGARQVEAQDSVNWESGQRLLINRSVDAAVFENTHRMILSQGLAYDRCSVGVITDLGDLPELAEFYIHDEDQLFNVVRTQVDVILPKGFAVLNAGAPKVRELAALCDGKLIFYGTDEHSEPIKAHLDASERAVFLRNDVIVLAKGREDFALLPLSALNPSRNDKPEMVMAAVAAAWALNVTPELIGAGLRTFDTTQKQHA
jgi:cyanophycin synthetase